MDVQTPEADAGPDPEVAAGRPHGSGWNAAEEPRGRDRFPGGADPLLSPSTHRRLSKVGRALAPVGVLAVSGLIFGLFTTLLTVWWGDGEFSMLSVLIRGSVYAVVVAVVEGWKRYRSR